MIGTFVTVVLVSAFFILFFKKKTAKKVKRVRKKPVVSTSNGFVEDTRSDPFIDHFIPPKYGNTGKFVAFSSIPENHWLHGFPHKKAK
jgi:hypothetical protein